ncbi:MAG TPA: hypothetical protein VGD98_09825 [Ktedonobacteraceae bacterium]
MHKAITLIIVWGADVANGPSALCPLVMRFAGNLRHASQVAEELEKEYPGSRRISYVREVACSFTPAPGSPEDPQPPAFYTILPEEGWEAEWMTEQRAVEAQMRREERDHR